ncbi:hypothetical protein B0H15DRAFT_952602 [Mycena belliarum]|uniref:Uncharacterized protein n=1 Tax=Mycena belliarum TaxID=1033014 RepID=A0AAD6U0U8_9AGAR|nr:hypothetical protein B0H15DRAFT_952602 [Mycena belliae]
MLTTTSSAAPPSARCTERSKPAMRTRAWPRRSRARARDSRRSSRNSRCTRCRTRLRHLTVDIADHAETRTAWVLSGARGAFQLRTLQCDFDWGPALTLFLGTQHELHHLALPNYLAPDDPAAGEGESEALVEAADQSPLHDTPAPGDARVHGAPASDSPPPPPSHAPQDVLFPRPTLLASTPNSPRRGRPPHARHGRCGLRQRPPFATAAVSGRKVRSLFFLRPMSFAYQFNAQRL